MRKLWKIARMELEADLARCYPVMAQLRPHLSLEAFIAQVQRQSLQGFQVAALEDTGLVRAVAGFRIIEMLAHGKFLYVDDLVTDEAARSHGYGAALFDWLLDLARKENCAKFQLDSGVQRFGAHRFYFRQRMRISSYHFSLELIPSGSA